MKNTVYLDHAATTPVDKRVYKKMMPYFCDVFGNASSQHTFGRNAEKAVDNARDTISKIVNCKPSEIYFTSGGTEADNWALKGVAKANESKGKHIIISSIEHSAMIESAKQLTKNGFIIDYIKVNKNGIIDLEDLKSKIKADTILICCMMANNEVGTIQPIKKIVEIAHEKGILVFTDCVQSCGVLDIDVKKLGVDLMSFSSHKIYGPKGVGALYIRSGVKIESLIIGGHQERTMRGGTTNVSGIVGFAEALVIADNEREKNNKHVKELRDYFISEIEKNVPCAKLNGDREQRVPANANFTFSGISGEELLFNLDLKGVYCSLGSACSSGSAVPSHVLSAMGIDEKDAKSTLRFTLGKNNTKREIDYAVKTITEEIQKMEKTILLFKKNIAEKEV